MPAPITRIALVVPAVERRGPRGSSRKSIPHLGIAYVARSVQRPSRELRIIDCEAEHLSEEALLRNLLGFRPDVVAFTAYSQNVRQVGRIAAGLKSHLPDVIAVVGGTHSSAVPEDTLASMPALDAAVIGEGEMTFPALLDAFLQGGPHADVSGIPGACGRRDGVPHTGPARPEVADLDALGFPDWSLLDLNHYSGLYHLVDRPRRAVPLATGRGCAFHCSFCFRSAGITQRLRSIPNVIEEVRFDIETMKAREFVILNESLLADHDHVLEFCEAMQREGFHRRVQWSCQSRVDHVSRDVVVALRRAGCRVLSMGIESGDSLVLDKTRKKTTLEQGIEAVRLAREAGLLTDVNFILGLPWDTPRSLAATVAHSLRVDADMTGFHRLTPYPGTQVLAMAQKGVGGLRLLSRDPSDLDKHTGAALELDCASRKDLDRWQRFAYWRFYHRPSRWLSALRMVPTKALVLTAAMIFVGLLRTALAKVTGRNRSRPEGPPLQPQPPD